MKNIFEMKKNNQVASERFKLNLNIPRTNQVTFGTNSLKSYGPKISKALFFNIKAAENLEAFETLIKKMEWRIMQLYNMQPIVACFYNFKNVNMYIKI